MTNLTKLRSSLLDKTKEFTLILSPNLLKNLILVGCAILLKETVNLNKLKNALGLLLENEQTLPNSHYRRLTRFFEAEVAQRHLWKGLMRWLMGYIRQWDGRQTRLFLTLDATCWEFGQTRIQLLVLSLVYRGISLPLCWVDLGKKGHSSQQERKRLLQMAATLYDMQGCCLLADREYGGREWFMFLEPLELGFIIRLSRQDYKAEISRGGKSYGSLLKRALQGKVVRQAVQIGQGHYQFVATAHQDGADGDDPLVLLLTNIDWPKHKVLACYRIRWCTESLFRHLKSNGFERSAVAVRSDGVC